MNIPAEQPREHTSLDEYGRGAESDCARAMAEIEKVLHELAHSTRRSSPNRTSPPNEASNAPSLVPAPSPIDRLVLDAGLDFVFHKDGMIELTEAGFRRMGQAHSAGLDTVIEVDRRYLLRFPMRSFRRRYTTAKEGIPASDRSRFFRTDKVVDQSGK